MLQKIENMYLGILRLVVILVAGLLLVAVVLFGLNSFRWLQQTPPGTIAPPKISDAALKNDLLKKDDPGTEAPRNATAQTSKVDPNQTHYEHAAELIIAFVTKESGGAESPRREQAVKISKDRAEKYDSPEVTAAYAQGFSAAVEQLLKDPAVVAAAKETSPLDVVNRLLNTFARQFDDQLEASKAKHQAELRAHMENKANAQQSLYFAAAAFGAFLMIVFLSIIIRIERNLRHLERAAA